MFSRFNPCSSVPDTHTLRGHDPRKSSIWMKGLYTQTQKLSEGQAVIRNPKTNSCQYLEWVLEHANQADLLSGEIPPRWDPTLTYCFCYLAEMGVWLLSRISTAECNNFARHTEIPGHKGWTFGPKPPKNYKKIVVRQYRTARFPISPEREEERAEYLEISISLEQKLFTAQCDMQIITED